MLKILVITSRFKPRLILKIKSPYDLILVVKMPVPTAENNLTTDKLYYDITDFKQYNL